MIQPRGSTTYRIRRGWVRLVRGCGYVHALIAAVYLGGYFVSPGEISLGLAAFGTLFFGGLAFGCFRLGHSQQVYSIEIAEHGIRQGSSGAWIPWADVLRFRERPLLNRIDLIGPGGATGIGLEYELEAFQEALDCVLRRVRLDFPREALSFRRPLLSWRRWLLSTLALGLFGFGAWMWIREEAWAGAVLVIVLFGALVHDLTHRLSEVTIANDSLLVRRGFRTTTYSIGDIRSVTLALRPIGKGNQFLDVYIDVRGEKTPVRPAEVDPFELFAALRSAVARAAG